MQTGNILYVRAEGTGNFVINAQSGPTRFALEAKTVLKDHKPEVQQRKEVSAKDEGYKWCLFQDDLSIVYFALVKQEYTNRLAYLMLSEVREIAKRAVDGSLTDRTRNSEIAQLMAKYENPANVDRLSKVNNQIEDVQVQLKDNLTQAVRNQGDLETMEMNSNKMREGAASFEKGSKDLKSIMYWRNMKLNIFIGVLVICVIVILILLFTNN